MPSQLFVTTSARSRSTSKERELCRHRHGLQRCLVTNQQGRAFGLHDLPLLQVGKQTRDSLARGPNHLGDLLMGESKFYTRLRLRCFSILRTPLEQEFCQLFGSRMRKPESTDF